MMETWHFVYYEDNTDTYSKGVNIEGKDLADCVAIFNRDYGFSVAVIYKQEK